jgi:hypothetical protein
MDCPLLSQFGNRYSRPNTTMRIGRIGHSTTTRLTTTMASTLARVHPFHLIPRTSILLSHSCRRRAMVSAWSSRSATATKTVPNPQPPLHDSPPVIIPTSNTPLSPDAASPQTAARPPPAPKATRPKPTLRPQKAALTLVSHHKSAQPFPTHPSLTVFFRFDCVDTHGRGAFANPDEQSDAADGPHRSPQQGLCWLILSPRICRPSCKVR